MTGCVYKQSQVNWRGRMAAWMGSAGLSEVGGTLERGVGGLIMS